MHANYAHPGEKKHEFETIINTLRTFLFATWLPLLSLVLLLLLLFLATTVRCGGRDCCGQRRRRRSRRKTDLAGRAKPIRVEIRVLVVRSGLLVVWLLRVMVLMNMAVRSIRWSSDYATFRCGRRRVLVVTDKLGILNTCILKVCLIVFFLLGQQYGRTGFACRRIANEIGFG